MSVLLGCIADDYTGASDLASTITNAGLRTVQTIGTPGQNLALPDVDAIVISLKTRSIPAADAIERSLEAYHWLRALGAQHILFKICSTFDSTDAGNIGPVLDALRSQSGDRIVVVTPAFPETGRTVYQGNLFVGLLPLNESPLKDHPLNPMRDANLVRLLSKQSRSKIGLVDRATVFRGVASIRTKLDELSDSGVNAAITDAIHDHDLEPIARAALDSKLSVGASGLGLGIARVLIDRCGSRSETIRTDFVSPVSGHTLCLAGSCSQATLDQISSAASVMSILKLDIDKLMKDSNEVNRAVDWASDRLKQSAALISSSCPPEEMKRLQAAYGREELGHRIEHALATIAEQLVVNGVRRLIVAGGETSGAIVDRLGFPGFAIGREIAPGVPIVRSIGWARGEMLLALKSGNFGGSHFFQNAISKMDEASRH